MLLEDMERTHYRFISDADMLRKLAYSLPDNVNKWLSSDDLNPLDMPSGIREFFSQQDKMSLLDAAQAYLKRAHALADAVKKVSDIFRETDANLAAMLVTAEGPRPMPNAKASKVEAGRSRPSGSDPWDLIARVLASGDIEGRVFIGGDVPDAKAQHIEQLVEQAVKASGNAIRWGEARRGSWWRPFKTAVSKRLSEADLDTLKRAAEVQLLDRHESESAKSYAEAIATLATAVAGEQHAYLAAKNVILLKTVDAEGRPVTVSRVLTPREVSLYQAGELDVVLSEPTTALKFLRSGALPVSEGRVIEGDGGE